LDTRAQVLLIVLAAVLLPGCTKRHDPGSASQGTGSDRYGPPRRFPGPPRQLKRSDLTEAEQKYGIAPVPDDTVTYQPDVIVVGGGAEAIRAQDPNGFRWTIDGDAPHADELVPGKIFFMTARAVGRVLDVRKAGADLIVTVGPVTLTEIVRKAHIHIEQMPIDFGEAIAYTSPELPGQVVSGALARPNDSLIPAKFVAESGWKLYPVQAAPGSAPSFNNMPDASKLLDKNFKTTPYVSLSAVGMRVSADGGGLKVSAETYLHFAAPTLYVDIQFDGLGIGSALIELKGAAGLTWKFAAGSDVGMRANVSALLTPDTDFSIPVGGIGALPLAVTVRQRFSITTALGVKDSTLNASGDYTFRGGFRVDYNKITKWGVAGPVGFTTNQSMTRTGDGLSMGVTGLTLANQVRVIVGIGIHGFAAGPYFSFTTAVGAFRGSAIGLLACNGATLVISLNGGIGYLIPKSITNLINSVLSLLNIKYRITGEGGLEPSTPQTIINQTNQIGGCKPPDADTPGKETLHGPV
jgi:hypothetical protein